MSRRQLEVEIRLTYILRRLISTQNFLETSVLRLTINLQVCP